MDDSTFSVNVLINKNIDFTMAELTSDQYKYLTAEASEREIEQFILTFLNDSGYDNSIDVEEIKIDNRIITFRSSAQDDQSEDGNSSFTLGMESIPESDNQQTWTKERTLLLIEEYRKRYSLFRSAKQKKPPLWREICEVLNEMTGSSFGPVSVDRKFRNLKSRYIDVKNNNNKKKTTGAGTVTWPYFAALQDLFTVDLTVNIPPATSSLPSTLPGPSSAGTSLGLLSQVAIGENNTNTLRGESPSPSSSQSSGFTTKGRVLDTLRKKSIDIEERKLKEIMELRKGVEENNRLQAERNEILNNILLQLSRS